MPKVHLKVADTVNSYCGLWEGHLDPYPLLTDTLKDWVAVEPEDRCAL
jgi:hypothetical protein